MRSEIPPGKIAVLSDMVYISGFCVFSKPGGEVSGSFLSCPHPFNLLALEKASIPSLEGLAAP